MKHSNVLYTVLSSFVFFYSFGMEQPETRDTRKETVSLIAIIKTQQNILGYTPSKEELRKLSRLVLISEEIKKLDPKSESSEDRKLTYKEILYEQALEIEPINYINLVIYQYPIISERIRLIEERFHDQSLYFLLKTKDHNERILEQQQLLDYYQRITQKESPIEKTITQPKPQQPMPPKIVMENPILEKPSQKIPQVTKTPYQPKRYKPSQKSSMPPKQPAGWLEKLQTGITVIADQINNFFKSIYHYFFG